MLSTEQFTYWLQGFFEISEDKTLSEKQVLIIKDHLALVFDKQTPNRNEVAIELETKRSIITPGIFPISIDTNKVICATEKSPWEELRKELHKKGPTVYC